MRLRTYYKLKHCMKMIKIILNKYIVTKINNIILVIEPA